MRRAIFPFLVICAGCAIQPSPERLAALAKTDSTPNLCAATLVLPPASVEAAQNELRARAATCDWDQARAIASTYLQRKQIDAEQQQARTANMMAVLGVSANLLQQSGPHTIGPEPVTTNCHQAGYYWTCNSY